MEAVNKQLITFIGDEDKNKVLRLRATMKGKTKSSLYRTIVNDYLNK